MTDLRPFNELRSEGLLWLINTTVFHPRGYAIAMHFDDEGNATGWSLEGDGSERWAFAETPEQSAQIDSLFLLTKQLLP